MLAVARVKYMSYAANNTVIPLTEQRVVLASTVAGRDPTTETRPDYLVQNGGYFD